MAPNRARFSRCLSCRSVTCDLCSGSEAWERGKPIPQDHFFAGDDLGSDANLLGTIAFLFACFGGGTPLREEFAKNMLRDKRRQIAPYPYVAHLPRQMLNRPRGGALPDAVRCRGCNELATNPGESQAAAVLGNGSLFSRC